MEGTHGQLSTGLADGLCRDNADGLAHVDRAADGKVDAVALRADAACCLAGKDAADEDTCGCRALREHQRRPGHEHVVGVEEHFAVSDR